MERGESHERLDPRFHHPRFHTLYRLSHYPTLGSISVIVTKGESPLWKGDNFVSEGVPFIKAENISGQGVRLEGVDHITPEVHVRMSRSQLRPGHVVLSMAGTIGVAAVIPETLPEANTNQDLAKIVLEPAINPRYVATFLNSDLGRLQMERLSTGTTRQHINFEQIKSIHIPIPDRPVQDAVADKMDTAYRRKRELEAEAGLLLESIDGYVLGELGADWGKPPDRGRPVGHEAVWFDTWRRDVKRLDPKRYRYQREGPLPKGLRRLGDLLTRRQEKIDRSKYAFEELQLISLHFDGTMSARDVKPWRKDVKGTLWFACPGDLIYSKIDARNGAIGLVPDELGQVAVTSEYPVYRVKEGISAEYLRIVLRTLQFTDLLQAMAAGHSGRRRIQPGELEDVLIPVPLLDQQRKIAAEVRNRRERAAALQEEAERVVAEAKAEVERMILGEAEGSGAHR